MQAFIIKFMEDFGYLGTFLLIFIENVFPPIPSEVILTFGGFMTTTTTMTIPLTVISATLGSVAGAMILYYLGHFLNKERLEKIVLKYGSILRVKTSDLDKADNWFARYGYRTIFFCRMVPILRSLISIPAGMAKMDLKKFLLYTTLGTAIWNTILVVAGAALGKNWEIIVHYIDIYKYVIIGFIGIAFIGFVAYKVAKKRKEQVN